MGDNLNYYEKISARNKSPEEVEKIVKLFNDNINIAYKVASKYYKTNYWDYDEALQIAQTGLWKACLIWDPKKFRISTLAYNVINRDFMDYDNKQKKQPKILFNLEDNCVTEDLSLNDVLVDETKNLEKDIEDVEHFNELNDTILKILNEIADDYKLSKSVVKLIYLIHVESNLSNLINYKLIDFVPRATIKQIVNELQIRLSDIL